MTKIKCKIMTDAFAIRVARFLNKVSSHQSGLQARFTQLDWRRNLNTLWNDPEAIRELPPDFKAFYEKEGVLLPHYSLKTFDCETVGLQAQIRIKWNGKITKVDEIDEIYSYKLIYPQD